MDGVHGSDRRSSQRGAVIQEPGLIAAYVESLCGRLSFDAPLAKSVRREVADHLHESAAAGGGTADAERRAIAGFGEPQAIAGQLAAVALARRARELGIAVVAVLVLAYGAMQARLAWYALTRWGLSEEARAISAVVATVDRYAFWLSGLIALAAALFAVRRRLRPFCLLAVLATAALMVSVVCDGVLTTLRLSEAAWSPDFLVPLFSMAVEIACATVLVTSLHGLLRRMAATSQLLEG